MDYKKYIADRLTIEGLGAEEIAGQIAVPPDTSLGDFALPCFRLAKVMHKSPAAIAEELKRVLLILGKCCVTLFDYGEVEFACQRFSPKDPPTPDPR